jgi:TonB family protein
MTDMKALFTQRFDAARTAWSQGDELGAVKSLHSAIAAARSDPGLRRELTSALFTLGKLSRKFGPAGEEVAGPLLTEALAIGEELFGSENAALAPVLHELSRLHLQQAQPARAEEALRRLLEIARVKSEEHPDVAAALSDLAFVKRKLGDDAAAEALYRDALRIREKVLEPNHMATVSTLERLSETCAARGNFSEALALLHRALPARETLLGADHERVRAARSRVAQLELQMAIAADTAAAARATRDAKPTPAWLRLVPDSPVDTPSTHAPSPVDESARPSGRVTGRESRGASRDVVLADAARDDVASGDAAAADAALSDWRAGVALARVDSPESARRKPTAYAFAGVAAVAIVIAGLLMMRPRADSGRASVSAEKSAAQRTTSAGVVVVTARAPKTLAAGTRAATSVMATRADSLRAASATSAPTAPVIQREQRARLSARPELRLPRVDVHLDSVILPDMPAAPSVDWISRSAMERRRVSDITRTETRDDSSRPVTADVDTGYTSPKIIGPAPDLAFPAALLRSGRREGRVVLRFMVNELGRVDVATVVVEQSDQELFTAAVRAVLPRLRFEPARTLGRASKPVAAWVSVPFRFTTKP